MIEVVVGCWLDLSEPDRHSVGELTVDAYSDGRGRQGVMDADTAAALRSELARDRATARVALARAGGDKAAIVLGATQLRWVRSDPGGEDVAAHERFFEGLHLPEGLSSPRPWEVAQSERSAVLPKPALQALVDQGALDEHDLAAFRRFGLGWLYAELVSWMAGDAHANLRWIVFCAVPKVASVYRHLGFRLTPLFGSGTTVTDAARSDPLLAAVAFRDWNDGLDRVAHTLQISPGEVLAAGAENPRALYSFSCLLPYAIRCDRAFFERLAHLRAQRSCHHSATRCHQPTGRAFQ